MHQCWRQIYCGQVVDDCQWSLMLWTVFEIVQNSVAEVGLVVHGARLQRKCCCCLRAVLASLHLRV